MPEARFWTFWWPNPRPGTGSPLRHGACKKSSKRRAVATPARTQTPAAPFGAVIAMPRPSRGLLRRAGARAPVSAPQAARRATPCCSPTSSLCLSPRSQTNEQAGGKPRRSLAELAPPRLNITPRFSRRALRARFGYARENRALCLAPPACNPSATPANAHALTGCSRTRKSARSWLRHQRVRTSTPARPRSGVRLRLPAARRPSPRGATRPPSRTRPPPQGGSP
jgi:hypothetical protein